MGVPLPELTRVVLVRDLDADGHGLKAGMVGVIVSAHARTYVVDFPAIEDVVTLLHDTVRQAVSEFPSAGHPTAAP
jgi:hypothetical protein